MMRKNSQSGAKGSAGQLLVGSAKLQQSAHSLRRQGGYALIAMVTLLMIVGAMATGGMGMSIKSEHLAGNAIQRSRSFQATDGAAALAEQHINQMMEKRVFADPNASQGIYERGHREEQWWRTGAIDSIHVVDTGAMLGVVEPPRYVIEQVGDYVSDGGTGVVSLDIGGAAYGRGTKGGREFLLFSVESHGNGSFDSVEAAVETTVAYSY